VRIRLHVRFRLNELSHQGGWAARSLCWMSDMAVKEDYYCRTRSATLERLSSNKTGTTRRHEDAKKVFHERSGKTPELCRAVHIRFHTRSVPDSPLPWTELHNS